MPSANSQTPMTVAQAKHWLINLKDLWISPGFEAPRARNSIDADSVLFQACAPMPAKEALAEIEAIEDQWMLVYKASRQIRVKEDTQLWLMRTTRQEPLNETIITSRPELTLSVHARAEEVDKHPDLNKGWIAQVGLPNLIRTEFKESERGQALKLHHTLRGRHLTSHFKDNR